MRPRGKGLWHLAGLLLLPPLLPGPPASLPSFVFLGSGSGWSILPNKRAMTGRSGQFFYFRQVPMLGLFFTQRTSDQHWPNW